MPVLAQLPVGNAVAVQASADAFLDSLGNPNTVRSYGIGVGKTAEHLGASRLLAAVTGRRSRRGAGLAVGQAGAWLLMLMATSRHRKPENLRCYFKPSPDAVAELTSLPHPATHSADSRPAKRRPTHLGLSSALAGEPCEVA